MVTRRRFTTELDVRYLETGRRVLLTPLCWWTDVAEGRSVTVPAGFRYDGPSIPWIFMVLYSPTVEVAATIHDYLYATHVDDQGEAVSRRRADRIFFEACKVAQRRTGAGGFRRVRQFVQRWAVYLAVRAAGFFAYRQSWGRKLTA